MPYHTRSRVLRDTLYRNILGRWLTLAFTDLDAMKDPEIRRLATTMQAEIALVDSRWQPVLLSPEPRKDLRLAFRLIRTWATRLADPLQRSGMELSAYALSSVRLSLTSSTLTDRSPRVSVTSALHDAVVWVTVQLFEEVPTSLIRSCEMAKCSRIYLATKNQKFCSDHQGEARRLARRRATRTFRAKSKKSRGGK
jgi:hypothetical protein